MNIREFQEFMAQYHITNFGIHMDDNYRMLLGCMEELGELAHAHLKGKQNIKYTPEEIRDLKMDAIGDIMGFLAVYCQTQSIDMEECLDIVSKELKSRKWRKR